MKRCILLIFIVTFLLFSCGREVPIETKVGKITIIGKEYYVDKVLKADPEKLLLIIENNFGRKADPMVVIIDSKAKTIKNCNGISISGCFTGNIIYMSEELEYKVEEFLCHEFSHQYTKKESVAIEAAQKCLN